LGIYIVSVFVIFLVLYIVLGTASVFKDLFGYFAKEIRYLISIRQPLSSKQKEILNKYSAYYRVLSADHKKEFEKRLQRFLHAKRFISRSSQQVTEEMKVLISASAVQLTFGLTEIYLSNFDKILIYPDAYYSNITQKYHLGEVNPRAGIIILSWKSFVEGYADLTDNRNLGIHEMAHALHFENRIRNSEYGFLDYEMMEQLNYITEREMKRIKSTPNHFFRDYAATNAYEFFAVSLEYFFESPKEFRTEIPDYYALLVKILNQDPIRLYKLEA